MIPLGVRTCHRPQHLVYGWNCVYRLGGFVRPAWNRDRLGRRLQSKFLAEDLVHHLGAPSKGRHDLMPVNEFGRGGLVVPGQQGDRLDRDAMGR